ncbi:hypothetical protein PpBr36_03198 [Pyricularia pennisetigena]|uniref:hypothetical protein n=1 Tax=Pyricularia pennisetigena TaxID=1578925 RepID=UPI00114F2098|nr:hypothetical protein PpBr36_03198 [Pyricularia pennisetigena]TLS30025.1 hypothetical protein PpBr36_03198 [Pyricularia pennisetigena]
MVFRTDVPPPKPNTIFLSLWGGHFRTEKNRGTGRVETSRLARRAQHETIFKVSELKRLDVMLFAFNSLEFCIRILQ